MAIHFLCLISIVQQSSLQWVSDGKIARILIKGYSQKDVVPLRDTPKNPLTPSGNDEDAEVITEYIKLVVLIL